MCLYETPSFLPVNHPWRKDKDSFDGTLEHGLAPIPLSGEDVLRHLQGYSNIEFGKNQKQQQPSPLKWKK